MARHSLTARTEKNIHQILTGQRRGWRVVLPFAGPAVIASVAYMDPGNYATNIQAGAQYGFALLWVVLAANLIAMLFQGLSAKLGIVTGKNLAEMCRDQLPRKCTVPLWLISELAAMATDLAEFLGGAIGLSLLLHVPLLVGMALTAVITYAILLFDRVGFRPVELIIGAFVLLIGLCYLAELFIADVSWLGAAEHLLSPTLPDKGAVAIAVGIIGATVMPHAVYLHSGLIQSRAVPADENLKARYLRFAHRETLVALCFAGMVNLAMVVMAAEAFYPAHKDVDSIHAAYETLKPLLGAAAAAVFLASLIASGISSSVVGTLAGQMIMQGFLRIRIPIWIRRVVTMIPAFILVAYGVNEMEALVVSQIILSFALPFPMIALVFFTGNKKIMGRFVNGRWVQGAAIGGALLIIGLNMVLLLQVLGAKMVE